MSEQDRQTPPPPPPPSEEPAPSASSPTSEQQAELGLYERLAERTKKILEQAPGRTSELLDKAIEKAKQQLKEAGEASGPQLDRLQEFLKRDLAETGKDFGKLGGELRERLHPSRVGAGFLSLSTRLLERASGALKKLSERADAARQYSAGEICGPGTLTCAGCGKEMHIRKTGHIPPCAGCQGTSFEKHY